VSADDGAPILVPAGTETDELTAGLGARLGCRVRAFYWVVPAGGESGEIRSESDFVLVPIDGGCQCRVQPVLDGEDLTASDKPLTVRLRVGEVLYAPGRFSYALSEAYGPCVVLLLDTAA
jgi:hypothetical protein